MELVNLGSIVDTLKINANFNNLAYEKNPDFQNVDLEKKLIVFNKKDR